MPLLTRNVDLGPALKLSSWRKVAIGTWRSAGDPSVYGILDLEAGPALAFLEKLRRESGAHVTITHLVGKAVAETIRRHPAVNCILRFGRLYPRRSIDIFYQVATDDAGEDLSGMTVRQADSKSLRAIGDEMAERVRKIKAREDRSFTRMKATFGLLPGFLASAILTLSGFVMYALNLWTPLFGSPRDPFGSAMITNVGSLGLETAFAPLVPYSRVPLLIAVGAVRDSAIVRDGQVVAAPVLRLCATFDHRLIDGVHAGHMSRTLKKIFADPERELG
jgi:pyruvate dehydrogenase E2 component (dihydrolipoamide acetyltransferase)